MKNSTRLNRTVIVGVAGCLPLLLTGYAQAQDGYDLNAYDQNGWYIGANIGKTSARIDDEKIRTSLQNDGFVVTSIAEDRRDTGYKAYLGYQFGDYVALEGGYFELNEFSFAADTLPVTDFWGKTGLKGWNLDLVGILPLTDRFSATARVGLTQNKSTTRFGSNGLINTASYNQDDSYTKHKVGLGLQYELTKAFTVRLEAERYRMDDLVGNKGDLDMYSLGVVYRFGAAKTWSEPVAAPAPVSRATVAAAASPEVAPAAQVLVLEDVHFNFDTAALNDNTKVILRQHVQTLKANPQAKVRIAGYTSASGSKEYNQALSERRAQSIKAFLIAEGVAANRFKTIGFGETQPAAYEARPSVIRSDAAKANMRGLFEIIVE